jgi:hypothetical protein
MLKYIFILIIGYSDWRMGCASAVLFILWLLEQVFRLLAHLFHFHFLLFEPLFDETVAKNRACSSVQLVFAFT